MSTPLSALSEQALNTKLASSSSPALAPAPATTFEGETDIDLTWHDPPSSPFIENVDPHDQENTAPDRFILDDSKPQGLASPQKHSNSTATSAQEQKQIVLLSTPSLSRQSSQRRSPAASVSGSPTKCFASPSKSSVHSFDAIVQESTAATAQDGEENPATTTLRASGSSPIKQQEQHKPSSPVKTVAQSAAPKSSSPAKSSPLKRIGYECTTQQESYESYAEHTLRENEGLTVTMRTMERAAEEEEMRLQQHMQQQMEDEDEDAGMDASNLTIDDTCFSTFSEVPNADMTRFAKLRQSPSKGGFADMDFSTPKAKQGMTPSTMRRQQQGDFSPSPTPRRQQSRTPVRDLDTTNLLLDFTEQIQAFSSAAGRSPSRNQGSPTKAQGEPNLLAYINNKRSPGKSDSLNGTPEKRKLLNLLDFELPPPATPRSIPTITIKEMESMKSGYLSQISQLTASVSGKDATIESLTRAVSDAERRVGEAQETVRVERAAREHAEREKAEWEKKGQEVEGVLRSIRKEIMASEKEREDVLRKLEDAERRAEDAEGRASDAQARALEAEGKLVDQSVLVSNNSNENEPSSATTPSSPRFTADQVQKQIDDKVEHLCRELHLVYKKKHETKVAALKKSYEAKSEKRAAALQQQLSALQKAHDDLQAAKDATFSGVLPANLSLAPPSSTTAEEDLRTLDAQRNEIAEQNARLAGLESEMRAIRDSHTTALADLERERVEKGELVAAAEQMLQLQADMAGAPGVGEVVEDFRKSIGVGMGAGVSASPAANSTTSAAAASRFAGSSTTASARGLRQPGESRIGRLGGATTPSSYAGKSRLMGNIERMGGGGSGMMRGHY